MSKEAFKQFVKGKPELAKLVANGVTTWQKLYETYDIYGEKKEVWQNFVQSREVKNKNQTISFSVMAELLKSIDLETVQKGITGLQKAIGLLQNITNKDQNTVQNYEERPIYKYYED